METNGGKLVRPAAIRKHKKIREAVIARFKAHEKKLVAMLAARPGRDGLNPENYFRAIVQRAWPIIRARQACADSMRSAVDRGMR